jgi:hypothetical protein
MWLKNGYGVDLLRLADGTVDLTVIRRSRNRDYKTEAGTKATRNGTATITNVDVPEIMRVLNLLHVAPRFMRRDSRLNTIGQIMTEAARSGNQFFTGQSARWVKLTWAAMVYPTFGPAGTFFVTGEIPVPGERRRYTVRRAYFTLRHNPHHGDMVPGLRVVSASKLQEFHRVGMAKIHAEGLAQTERDRYAFVPRERGTGTPPRVTAQTEAR